MEQKENHWDQNETMPQLIKRLAREFEIIKNMEREMKKTSARA